MPNLAGAFLFLALVPFVPACGAHAPDNPPCAGFDRAGSDPKAIAIADEVMRALGGRAAWDNTKVICWTFFGGRKHVWNKQTGDYRLESKERVVLMNLNTGAGRVYDKGVELTDAAKRDEALKKAHSIWVNDSYWLVMPYKLKDSGVTLKCKGEADLDGGRKADVLELTFKSVGDTPDNRYLVYVSRDKHWVERWDYFAKKDDEKPSISTPWTGWEMHNGIELCGGRGEKQLTDLEVLNEDPPRLHAL